MRAHSRMKYLYPIEILHKTRCYAIFLLYPIEAKSCVTAPHKPWEMGSGKGRAKVKPPPPTLIPEKRTFGKRLHRYKDIQSKLLKRIPHITRCRTAAFFKDEIQSLLWRTRLCVCV